VTLGDGSLGTFLKRVDVIDIVACPAAGNEMKQRETMNNMWLGRVYEGGNWLPIT